MQNNILKKVFGIIALLTLFFTSSLLSANPIRIMPLGDSITLGSDTTLTDPTVQIAYRGPLWTQLSDSNYSIDFVGSQLAGSDYFSTDPTFDLDHEGHGGFRADQIASNINSYLTANPADIVLLHIGTNDLTQNQSIESTVADVNTTLENIDSVSKDIKVIIARIINRATYDPDTTTFNNQLNTMLQQRISNGDDIMIVDMENNASIDYTTDMTGEVHPNTVGYEKIANNWFGALQTTIPTHLWKFDEPADSTIFIDTYRDNNGTCTGANCPQSTPGMLGTNARIFDGNDEVTVSDDDTFDWNISDSFTIEFWVKPTRTGGANQVIVGRENEARDNLFWWAGIFGSTGQITFRLRDSNGIQRNLDGPVLNADEWYHITCIRDAANNQNIMYVNGSNVASTLTPYTGNFAGTTPVNVGYLTLNGSNNYHLESAVDELTVYNGALNAAQVNLHYKNGLPKALSIISVPVTLAEFNELYSYDVNSSHDPSATFVLNTSPAWMNIDTDFGIINGTPDTVGNFDVEVQADTSSETAIQNYVLKVRNTAILPSGMSHYWKFDETELTDSRTYIDSYAGADGNCTGGDAGCPTPRQGRINGAQSFDGSDMVDVMDTTGFAWAGNDSFTIEYWIRIDDGTDLSNNMVVIGRDGPGNPSYTWWSGIEQGTGKAIFSLRDSNNVGNTVKSIDTIVGNTGIHEGGHHIAVVRDGDANETRLYVDGALQNTTTQSYAGDFMDASVSTVNIGYLNFNGTPAYFLNNGTSGVDEMAVFNTALSGVQILEHYSNSLAGNSFEVLVDTTAPTLTEVTAVPTPTNILTPVYTFSSDEAGTISYGGSCTSATTVAIAGDNTITFTTLTDGTYSDCTITVTDAANNPSTPLAVTTFTVNIVVPDTTVPVITLIGPDPQMIVVGSAYTELNATAQDNVDGDISANIVINALAVDTNTPGQYTVTYDVNDSAGNAAVQVTRTVNVVDATVPVTESTVNNSGGGCSYNPDSKNFDITFLLMMVLGLIYPFRRRFIKQSSL